MFTGPDVSEHQGDVDWKRVSGNEELAIVRVSDGDHRDPFYTEGRVRAVREAGLLLAPYYFARVASPQNNERDGAAECSMVLGFAKSRGWKWPGDLPLIYDFETSNAQPNAKCARHIVQFVRAYHKSEGHYPGIYTMPGFWAQVLPHLSKSERQLIARCFLHQAEWGVDAAAGARAVGRRGDLAVDRQRQLRRGQGRRRHESLAGLGAQHPRAGKARSRAEGRTAGAKAAEARHRARPAQGRAAMGAARVLVVLAQTLG